MQQQRPTSQQITIDLPPEAAEGVYANVSIIAHNASEFVLDFARLLPGLPKAKVHARIILTPAAAKGLHRSLGQNLDRFEAQHGEIKAGGPQEPGSQIGFHSS
ncbi:MAG: DUF3467 domain-containing protein [Candidatus Krumholzibacteriia bacterium]